MTDPKKKRGRPKKIVAPVEPKNPDCEQATKGFVKCLMRKYDKKHTHEQRGSHELSCLGGMVFASVWLVLAMFKADAVYLWMAGVAAIVLFIVAFEFDGMCKSKTLPATGDGLFDIAPVYLWSYVAPTECEYKPKECE